MAAIDYICDLDGGMLLQVDGFACGPLALAVSTLVALGPDANASFTATTPQMWGWLLRLMETWVAV